MGRQAREADQPMADPNGEFAWMTSPPETKITVEHRGEVVLIGINRPYIQNRIDPEAFYGLAKAYHDYDHDPS
jgi:enoyl-CoA hydratase